MDKARTMLEGCYEKMTKVLGVKHPTTLGIMSRLASVYDKLGGSDDDNSKQMRLLAKNMHQACYESYCDEMGELKYQRTLLPPPINIPSCVINLQ